MAHTSVPIHWYGAEAVIIMKKNHPSLLNWHDQMNFTAKKTPIFKSAPPWNSDTWRRTDTLHHLNKQQTLHLNFSRASWARTLMQMPKRYTFIIIIFFSLHIWIPHTTWSQNGDYYDNIRPLTWHLLQDALHKTNTYQGHVQSYFWTENRCPLTSENLIWGLEMLKNKVRPHLASNKHQEGCVEIISTSMSHPCPTADVSLKF